MKAWEREKLIIEQLKSNRMVSIGDICTLTGASVATVRRDFDALQERGQLVRTHGAVHLPEQQSQRSRYVNGTEIIDSIDLEKQQIAKEAAAQVRAGESIFIGAGKTCNMLAAMLGELERLTVVTTSITAVLELAQCPNISVTLLGGDVHTGKNYIETLDSDIAHTLRSYYFDKVFFTAEGVDLERGYTVQDKSRVALYTQLARMTRRMYMLLDSAKFDRCTFATIFSIDKLCRVITTQNVPESYVQFYAKHDIPCTALPTE